MGEEKSPKKAGMRDEQTLKGKQLKNEVSSRKTLSKMKMRMRMRMRMKMRMRMNPFLRMALGLCI